MEFQVTIDSNFKIDMHWRGKRKYVKIGWLLLQVNTGLYIPLGYVGRGIYKYK